MTTLDNSFYFILFFSTRFVLMYLLQRLPNLFRKESRINLEDTKQHQKDRESMWPLGLFLDTLLLAAVVGYGWTPLFAGSFWSCLLLMIGLHIFLVEPIYYGFHLLLHHKWFYKRFHAYHHRSVRVDPTTSMSFTLGERASYTALFAVPSVIAISFYLFNYWSALAFYLLFDIANSLGHLNIKLEPEFYKKSPLHWFFYSPEYHEKHHSEFNTNYALFMPIWDRLFGTVSKTTEEDWQSVDLK